MVCICGSHYIFVEQCFYKIFLTLEIYLFVDEEKTPEQIMQEKQIEAYVIFKILVVFFTNNNIIHLIILSFFFLSLFFQVIFHAHIETLLMWDVELHAHE